MMNRTMSGAPMPPPIWQLICEFANGSCTCAATRADGPPCDAVTAIERRIIDRAYHDLSQTHQMRRKPRHGDR